MSSSKFFFIKKSFKVALQYLFNFVLLLNTVFNLKLNFKLKIDPKTCTFKILKSISESMEEIS